MRIRSVLTVTLTVVCLFTASPARADWVFNYYLGASKTASNSITIEPNTGNAITIDSIEYAAKSFESPRYYGSRLTYFLANKPWLGIGIEFTHNKAIADIDQLVSINGGPPSPLSDILGRLELSNGLNFALANVMVRRPVSLGGIDDRLAVTAYGGLGAAVPHVETIFDGETKYEYQLTGLGWQAGAGTELRIAAGLSAVADFRVTGGPQTLDMGTGTLKGSFTSAQLDFGAGWRFGAWR